MGISVRPSVGFRLGSGICLRAGDSVGLGIESEDGRCVGTCVGWCVGTSVPFEVRFAALSSG